MHAITGMTISLMWIDMLLPFTARSTKHGGRRNRSTTPSKPCDVKTGVGTEQNTPMPGRPCLRKSMPGTAATAVQPHHTHITNRQCAPRPLTHALPGQCSTHPLWADMPVQRSVRPPGPT